MTMQNITKQARGMVLGIIPDEYRQSLPIPCLLGNRIAVDFLFLPTQRIAKGQELFPPKICVRFTAEGTFVRAFTIFADELLPGHQAGVALGAAHLLESMNYDEYMQRRNRYLDLLSSWCLLRQQNRLDQFGSQQAQETLALFQAISEKPLRDYYLLWGRDFFRSLHQLSQNGH